MILIYAVHIYSLFICSVNNMVNLYVNLHTATLHTEILKTIILNK
jgi:hypothetical protein